jgi:hypothetical protein
LLVFKGSDRTQFNHRGRNNLGTKEKKKRATLKAAYATIFVCVLCMYVDVKVIFFFGSIAPDMAPVGGGENRRSRLRCLLEESALSRTQQSN